MSEDREASASRMRASDADRHRVAEILQDAAGAGRLDLDELEERLEATYAAKTYADLVPLTADLPDGDLPSRLPVRSRTDLRKPARPPARSSSSDLVVPGPEHTGHAAVMGGFERRGHWVVPRRMTVVAVMGGATLDMREAQYAAREVVVTIHAVMGGVDVIVGPETQVVMEGIGIMGGYSGPPGGTRVGSGEDPVVVRVRGVAFWGGVTVSRRPLP